ncbi:DNA-directed RNA polymerase subunit delta [Cytobacillus sp. IB215316]|uniref:DNA-directed RNA polymerase subunit delta n=1 Tax=Cytobacillus sp. IB215316 TaxID=3097354 RepID=UPI002A118E3E|nr:DNA-directed RNA polymerase subunit delta [Cytobacillus sp. IB215316]MDX8361041.1 DNA-directed RNA polymerase subunit delta [Cytobacillus sp. IB215316]
MSLKQYSLDQLKEMSLIEIAFDILSSRKKPIIFKELVDDITASLHLSQDEINAKISQFYTDINIDGRFICVGENLWGLRSWYPYEKIEEEVTPTVKSKKKKSKKASEKATKKVEEESFDDLDDFEEEDIELDLDDIDDLDEETDEDLEEDFDLEEDDEDLDLDEEEDL